MSFLTKSISLVSDEGVRRTKESQQTHKFYYRESTGEYIIASPGSDTPSNAEYQGKWIWDGARVRFLSRHVSRNERN